MHFPTPQGTNSATFTPPPVDGSLYLAEVYDFLGQHSPNHPVFVYDDNASLETITWSTLVRAIHTAARLVEGHIRPGDRNKNSTVVAVLSTSDFITNFVLVAGIMRAGYQAFPISTRNSAVGIAHLVRTTRVKYMFVGETPSTQRLAAATCAQPSVDGPVGSYMSVHPMPAFDTLFLPEAQFVPLPPMVHPQPKHGALILHSSGTTSFPKPVYFSQQTLLQWGMIPYFGETDLCGTIMSYHSLTLPYALGATCITWAPISGITVATFPPTADAPVPTPERVLAGALSTSSSIILCVPAFIEAWVKDPVQASDLRGFSHIFFAGAPLRKESGDLAISQSIQINSFYGATEIGCASVFVPKGPAPREWQYFKFSPHVKPKLVPHSEDVYQLIMMQSPTCTLDVINVEYDGERGYNTNDLITRHPTIPDLWRVCGRADEQIILSTGTKTNTLPIESAISRHPLVRACLVFGQGRNHIGILVEPVPEHAFDPDNETELEGYRNKIWPAVQEANETSPIYSRIFKEMILVTKPSKPFIYTLKQTPKRNDILAAYAPEIEKSYGLSDNSYQGLAEMATPEAWGVEECTNVARMAVHTVLMQPLRDDMDIFQAGCDSVQATQIRMALFQTLRRAMKVSTRQIPHNFVYFNPTIKRLGTYIAQIVHYGHSSVALAMLSGKISEMEGLALKYGSSFPTHRPSPGASSSSSLPGDIVLLTGSTGSFGTYILESLIKDPTVSKVYALNRQDVRGARSVYIRQSAQLNARGLDFNILDSNKLVLLEGDASVENMGLQVTMFEEIRTSITCIIHAAWNVNFNVALSSMEPLIAATRRLADLALSSPHQTPPRLLFVSSVNVFNNWTGGTVAPEDFNPRPATAIGSGYAESKWVAEKILVKAAAQTPLKPCIVRIGQICGGLDGSWSAAEWFPTLVASGPVLRCLPQALGYISWIPAHHAANALIEIRKALMLEDCFGEDADYDMDIDDDLASPDTDTSVSSLEFTDSDGLSPTSTLPPSIQRMSPSNPFPPSFTPQGAPPTSDSVKFINLVHPHPVPAAPMMERLGEQLGLPLVRYSEWLNALESAASTTSSSSMRNPSSSSLSNPAISLLHFYRSARPPSAADSEAFGFTAMKTNNAVDTVPWLKDLSPIGREDVDKWVEYWRRVGLLRS
ncbi:putative NRPS-like protein biosynthetic cluster [Marasmius tenuissimus]|nr:putative NRPS-like protein biosynthetic cluster [Marasmius tenuissimus]